jgi:xylan 1,4-beta-xylosidase
MRRVGGRSGLLDFPDVFEEQGVVKTPFYGGFGLLTAGGVPKPAFNAFKLLHRLGDERIELESDWALLTRRKDGSLVLAVWNYAPPDQAGEAKTVTLRFKGLKLKRSLISRLDAAHGDFHAVYEKKGSPRYPKEAQIQQLTKAAEVTLTLPAHGLAVIELR